MSTLVGALRKLVYVLDEDVPGYDEGRADGYPPIARPQQVDVMVASSGGVAVWVFGMTPTYGFGTAIVDQAEEQPDWLAAIIADAHRKLAA